MGSQSEPLPRFPRTRDIDSPRFAERFRQALVVGDQMMGDCSGRIAKMRQRLFDSGHPAAEIWTIPLHVSLAWFFHYEYAMWAGLDESSFHTLEDLAAFVLAVPRQLASIEILQDRVEVADSYEGGFCDSLTTEQQLDDLSFLLLDHTPLKKEIELLDRLDREAAEKVRPHPRGAAPQNEDEEAGFRLGDPRVKRGWLEERLVSSVWSGMRWHFKSALPPRPEAGVRLGECLDPVHNWLIAAGYRRLPEAGPDSAGPLASSPLGVEFAPDYSWLRCPKGVFKFTPSQRQAIRALVENYKVKGVGLSNSHLCGLASDNAESMKGLFKGHPAWMSVVCKVPGSKDLYCLDPG